MTSQRFIQWTAILSVLMLGWLAGSARGQIAVRQQGFVPFSDAPIYYLSDNLHDPVATLQKRIAKGGVTLDYEPRHGYLRSVLSLLDIPVSSQTLVFSKTSFQFRKISPQTPRALYFNDDVYVGWVLDGKVLEIVSFDPNQGAIFYLLDEERRDRTPGFERAELDCTQCHIANSTRGVPGVMLRSIVANPSGTQAMQTESYITGQQSPLKERFGGWYVTGTHGRQSHMGNAVLRNPAPAANLLDLTQRFDTAPYLTAHSDIVAHLVLAHQTQMHNLITLTNYRARIAAHTNGSREQYEKPAEELLRYLLFANEAPLEDAVHGDTTFAQDFAARGPRDSRGRSLRDFDLRTRLFKYPCSYLIYSDAFDSLPQPAREYIYHRLFEVLTGRDQSPDFANLTAVDRNAIREILLATKPGLPREWNQPTVQAAHPSLKKD